MNPLNSVPAKARLIMYWAGYILGVVGSTITSVWGIIAASSPDVHMPVGLVIGQAVLSVVISQLNLLAGSNVTSEEQYADEVRAWDKAVQTKNEAGVITVNSVLSLALLVLAVLAIIWFAAYLF